MNIELIALDMDGTTLNSQRKVSTRTYQAIEQALKKGLLIVPASGRTYLMLPEEITAIPGIRYIVASNGAELVDTWTNKKMYQAMLAFEEALAVTKRLADYPVYRYIHSGGRHYDLLSMEAALKEYEPGLLTFKARQAIENLEEFILAHPDEIEKVGAICFDQASYQAILDEEKKFGYVNMASTGDLCVEFNSLLASKGNALAHLCKELNILPDAVMAIGDNQNDISMLTWAGRGVAMGNASEEIKSLADEVTLTADEDGVAVMIESLL